MPATFDQVPWGTPHKQPINTGHEKIASGHWLGQLTCLLTAKTEVSIFRSSPTAGGFPFYNVAPGVVTPFLPGSTIKGVIRSFAEALTHSCSPLPDQAGHCQSRTAVCPACRLFGSQFGKQEQQNAGAYQSKVFFSDAKMEGNLQPSVGEINIHTPLPHPSPGGGRVIYKHFPPLIRPSHNARGGGGSDRNHAAIAYVPRGSQFAFTVDFSNLANDALNDEFSLLLYSLVLEERMAHKVGFGKAKGLGSVQIQITRLQASNQPREVYSSLTTPRFTHNLSSPDDIAQFVQTRRESFLAHLDQAQVQQLRVTLTLPDEL